MKIYILIETGDQKDIHNENGVADPYFIGVAGVNFHREKLEEIKSRLEKENADCGDSGDDPCYYAIVEHDVEPPAVSIAVEVSGGLVQNIYSDGERVGADVYDLDVSMYPDEGEEDEAAEKNRQIEAIRQDPAWRRIF